MTTLRLGARQAGADALFGELGPVRVLPFAVSDADLQNRVATF